MNLEEAKLKLSKYGQEQILRYYDELSDDEKAALLEQIDKTDMEVLSAIEHKSELVKKGEITPLGAMELDEIEANYDTFKNTGVEARLEQFFLQAEWEQDLVLIILRECITWELTGNFIYSSALLIILWMLLKRQEHIYIYSL